MTQKLQTVLDNLILQYEGYFNIEQPYTYGNRVILAYAHFVQRMEKYVLVQRAKLYATESFEHVFIVHASNLSEEVWEAEKTFIINAESDYVAPHSEHMYSYMTLILLCDHIDEAVKHKIKRLRYTKNYHMALHGYSTVRVAALDISNDMIITNAQGKELRKVLDNALHM